MVTAAVRTVQPRSSCRELASATASVLSSRSFGVVGLALFCAESNNGCLTPIPRAPRDLVPFLLPLPATYSALGRIYLKLVISEGLNSGIFHFSGGRTWQKPGLTCVTRSIGKNAPEHVERECRKCTAPRLPSAKGSHRDAQSSVWPARAHTLIGGGYRVAAFGASTGCLALVAPRCSFGGKLDASRTRPTVPSSLCLRGPGRVSAQLSADAKVASRGRLP